jgi:hypothetical protein
MTGLDPGPSTEVLGYFQASLRDEDRNADATELRNFKTRKREMQDSLACASG